MAITTAMRTQVAQLYTALFNRAPERDGLGYWVQQLDSGKTFAQVAQAMYAVEPARAVYPSFLTNQEIIAKFYTNVLGRTADTDGLNYWTGKLNAAGATPGAVIAEMITAVAAYTGTDAAALTSQSLFNNKVTVGLYYAVDLGGNDVTAATNILTGVTSAASSVDTAKAGAGSSSVVGSTFTLATTADVLSPNALSATAKTTAGDDTIYALTAASLTSADVVDASAGTDTLIADYDHAADDANYTVAPVLTSVEKVVIRNTGATMDGGETLTFNAANSTGVTNVTFDKITGKTAASNLVATGLSGVAAGVTNNATLAHTYTFTYTDAALAGTADTVTLNVTGNTVATGAVTIQNAASAAAGAGAETVAIVTSGTGSSAATTLGSLSVREQGGATQVMKTLKVSGTAALTINGALDFAGTTAGTIDATGMSGNLTLTANNNEAITFTGGSGKNTITTGTNNDVLTGGASDDTFTIGTGNDTVTGAAGNDRVVVTAISELTAADSINLGDGTRDTLAIGTWTAINTTNVTAANKTLINAVTGVEVVELTAANVAGVDFAAITQDIVRVSTAGTANNVVTNVATNDTLILTADQTGTTGASAIAASGVLPNQTLRVELAGTGVDITGVITAATDHALELSSNITTLQIDSTATTAGTANTIGGAIHASAFAIKNTSTQNLVITGNNDLTIANTTANGVTFSAGIDVNASTFTGKLVIGGSASADVIKGGTGNDTITAGAGNDSLDLSAGGNDKVVFSTGATNGKDTITGYAAGDTLNVALLGDGSTGALTATITAAAAQGAFTDDSAYIINTSGAAANLTTSGTATVTDFTNLTQVAAYLSERFTLTAGSTEGVIVINNTTSGANTTYVYSLDDAAGNTAIDAAELTLVGVVSNGGTALDSNAIVFA